MDEAKQDEGWGVIRPGDRKAHYYRDTMSLCRRIGLYCGSLEPGRQAEPGRLCRLPEGTDSRVRARREGEGRCLKTAHGTITN